MRSEALLFVQSGSNVLPSAQLAFTPRKGVALQSASGQISFDEGRDYLVDAQTRTITLPVGSRIPFVTANVLNPPPGSPNSMGGNIDGKNNLLWSEGHYFHDLQVEATYTHASNAWTEYKPTFSGAELNATLAILKRKAPLKIVVLGDSISAGYNASGFVGVAPMMPAYPELVRSNLQELYGSQVSLENFSVAGKTADWGLTQINEVVRAKPDLVILAFGMNDSSVFEPKDYANNIKMIIGAIRGQLSNTEFILVASSLPNPNWTSTRSDRFPLYREALQKLAGPGIAFADMSSVWAGMIARKKYLDLTGNGLNHPNDFGHRLYAQVILRLLTRK